MKSCNSLGVTWKIALNLIVRWQKNAASLLRWSFCPSFLPEERLLPSPLSRTSLLLSRKGPLSRVYARTF